MSSASTSGERVLLLLLFMGSSALFLPESDQLKNVIDAGDIRIIAAVAVALFVLVLLPAWIRRTAESGSYRWYGIAVLAFSLWLLATAALSMSNRAFRDVHGKTVRMKVVARLQRAGGYRSLDSRSLLVNLDARQKRLAVGGALWLESRPGDMVVAELRDGFWGFKYLTRFKGPFPGDSTAP